ncbi:MAG: hypothetical protein GVY11_07500 [Gammaproteobacteria bacterium]|nr:hypothetical protein [Gammaproteobacteria bacterium]
MEERGEDIHELDCLGLHCPEPVWRTRQLIADLPPGALIEVVADDPLAELDLRVFCQRQGHELVQASTRDGQLRARIRVSPGPRPDAG